MDFNISFILAPLLGAIIGYITNDIAIRMLFRPHKPKYIGKIRIPLTPGIIPKEKGRIATALGSSISVNLMNKEVLTKNLLSEGMVSKLRNQIKSFFTYQKDNEESVKEFLGHYLTDEDIEKLIKSIKNELSVQVSIKLGSAKLGAQISEAVIKHVSSKLSVEGLDINVPQILKSLIGTSLWGQLALMIEEPAKRYLAKNIDQILEERGPEIVTNLIDKGVNDFSLLSMKELLENKDQQIEQITDTCIGIYETIITDHLPRILDAINIPKIIENRINEMDMNETEKLIFEVMDKELKAIVWLGALLGMIMGSINLFFN